jgi:SAM-dependent methyltransferase
MTIDFGKTADDYGTYRQGFPQRFFDELVQRELLGPNQRVLDLGTGTGTLARGAALHGSSVVALDIAPELIDKAKVLDQQARVTVTYHIASAEQTGLDDAMFDLVMAGQCWHWFDRPVAAQEIKRLLVPGGAVVIAHLDWIPLPGNVVEATEQLILKHNPDWKMSGGTGLYPAWLGDLATAGFTDIETFSFDLDLMYTAEAWRGRIRASAGIAASLSAEEVAAFDRELHKLLQIDYPDEPLAVHHRVWTVIGCKP